MQTAEQTLPKAPLLLKLNPKQHRNFWRKVNKNGPIPEHIPHIGRCWTWTAGKNGGIGTRKYGAFGINYKMMQSHRVSWLIFNGVIPDGMRVCHKCDNPGCVNPSHLFLGTDLDNQLDKTAKGRGNCLKGEAHPRAKLSEAQVVEIRKILKSGTKKGYQIARVFNVAGSTISMIASGISWKHI